MENIGHPLPLHEWYGHTERKFILKLRVGTYKFTWNGMEIPYLGRMVDSFGTTWFRNLDAQAIFPLHKRKD